MINTIKSLLGLPVPVIIPLNHWKCECCKAVKHNDSVKFYTMSGVVCPKCNKGV